MVSAVDVKFQIDDELEAILYLVRRLEGDVLVRLVDESERKQLMAALKDLEDGVHNARQKLGE